ncbi:hypothetical protein [Polaribacter sargassicola]|uniref:hypothetical protein n=1 Tax=Polaribacter sargassicola TaxID=2836891 RepID=UPI001F435B78|nr:hypothetical protein [Polaribacter sp. DS7-9]MCG1037078.1 hypothetical protein [Polaribacter sp. DS7-9]
MECILIVINKKQIIKSETTSVGETLRVGDTHSHNGEWYIVTEIVLEPNKECPLIYCKIRKDKKDRERIVTKWN